jgi:hypothetical protein
MTLSTRLAALGMAAAIVCGTGGVAAAGTPATTSADEDHPSPTAGTNEATGTDLPPEVREQLREVRKATRAYRDVEAAEAAGYELASPCESDPKYGGMGFHYANPAYVEDGVLDLTKPEILVYQPTRDGRLRLGAVEYFQVDADQDLATDDDRPYMFGVPFDGPMLGHNPQMPIHYDLHVWLYRHNPAGIFAMWNPGVHCPDGEAHTAH